MTARRTHKDAPADVDADVDAAAKREAMGAAQEAIGKLIGDDAARRRGAAEKDAGAAEAADIEKSSRP